jgi:hypothetical protein
VQNNRRITTVSIGQQLAQECNSVGV